MAKILVGVAANLLGLATRLLTSLAVCILALSRSMARLAAKVRAASELVATNLTATDILEPTLLILEGLLPTHAPLLHKKRAFRTSLIILVAVVRHLRMTACLCSLTGVTARWWPRSARKRRMQDRTATATANLVENCLTTCTAWTFVAKLLTNMCTAFQQTTTLSSADVLGFKHIFNRSRCGVKRTLLALAALTLCGFALAGATSLIAAVSATVQQRPANSHALRRLIATLVTDRVRRRTATPTFDADSLLATAACPCMTDLLALVAAWKCLTARSRAARNNILARLSGLV